MQVLPVTAPAKPLLQRLVVRHHGPGLQHRLPSRRAQSTSAPIEAATQRQQREQLPHLIREATPSLAP
eukprot:7994119-Lingulodinium_polyedra.AAC.1